MTSFSSGLPTNFRAAWVACRTIADLLPNQHETDDYRLSNEVVRFCNWAEDGGLKAAEETVRRVEDSLSEPSIALELVAVARRLFDLCSPKTRKPRQVEIWDLRRFELRRTMRLLELPQEEYEEAVRSRLTTPEVRDSLKGLLSCERKDLLGKIKREFQQAASAEQARAAARPRVDAKHERPIEESLKPTDGRTPDCIESLGERRYRVGDRPCIVEYNDDLVLQAFLRAPGQVHTKSTLAKVAGLNQSVCVRVLRNLRGTSTRSPKYDGLFKPFITLPGQKSSGGYQVRIRRV